MLTRAPRAGLRAMLRIRTGDGEGEGEGEGEGWNPKRGKSDQFLMRTTA